MSVVMAACTLVLGAGRACAAGVGWWVGEGGRYCAGTGGGGSCGWSEVPLATDMGTLGGGAPLADVLRCWAVLLSACGVYWFGEGPCCDVH